MIDILMLILGAFLLYLGGEGLIRGAVSLANIFLLSKLFVSTVIIGFGTSMPEMTVCLGAALKGASDITIGSIIGSNIANILLITGFAACLSPISISVDSVKHNAYMMLFTSFCLLILVVTRSIGFIEGFSMCITLIAYIYFSVSKDTTQMSDSSSEEYKEEESSVRACFFALGGLLALIGGASLMVEGAINIARTLQLSEVVIGLSIVAIGTSLPELATAIIASFHKQSDVTIGNVLGSNIFNIFFILGLTAMVAPIEVRAEILKDLTVMILATGVLSVYLLKGIQIGRLSGVSMLISYFSYIGWIYKLF